MPVCRDERQKWQLHAACLEHVRLVMEAQPLDQLAQHRDACPPALLPIIDLLTGGQNHVSGLPSVHVAPAAYKWRCVICAIKLYMWPCL